MRTIRPRALLSIAPALAAVLAAPVEDPAPAADGGAPTPGDRATGVPEVGAPEAVAFVDVDVVPMDRERVLEGHTVVVRGDRIVEVAPAGLVPVPEDAVRVDGSGRYLIPGLTEMHAHVPPPDAGDHLEEALFLWVANGVTTVRGMLGEPGHLDLRERVHGGEILGPSMYLAGPPLSGNTVASPDDAARKVRELEREGWDFVKVLPGLTRDEYDAMARTAREVGLPFIGHVPRDVGLLRALAAGQATIDHLDGYLRHLDGGAGPLDEDALADVVRRTREAGARVVPTMALWEVLVGALDLETVTAYPELRYMPPDVVARWTEGHHRRLADPDFDPERARRIVANRTRVLEALHEGGVPVLLGTDSPQVFSVPGFSLRRELRRMAEAGMTPYEILAAGTRNAGAYLSDTDGFGTVAPGQRADLVLLEANPLDDALRVTRPAGVMVRGHWLDGDRIRTRLEEIAAAHTEARES